MADYALKTATRVSRATKTTYDDTTSFPPTNAPYQRSTSITGHVVQMASISMSFAELDILAKVLERVIDDVSGTESTIVYEFCRTVQELR